MNDITLHFMACFLITAVVFVIAFNFAKNKAKPWLMLGKEAEMYWWKRCIEISIQFAVVTSMLVGVGKELWDIWFSDPQVRDLVADAGGAMFAGILIWLIGMKWVEWRFRNE